MKKILSFIKKHLILTAVIVAVLFGALFFTFHKKTYSMNVSLVYQNASSGLNPNGSRYNPYLILSDEVLGKVEEEIDVDFKDAVWLRPSSRTAGSLVSTEYTLHCRGLSECPAILEKIADSYNEYFESHYTLNKDILSIDELPENYDYIIEANFLEKEANKLVSFVNKRAKENGSWFSNGNGEFSNFANLLEYGKNIIDVDIHNLKTYLTENGVSKDTESLKGIIEYRNRLLMIDKQKAEAQYSNRREAITLYDPTLFPTISVPSISGGEYYVTTTKTGLDYIYEDAATFSSSAYQLQTTISDNVLISRNMKTSAADPTAEEMIKDIYDKLLNYSNSIEETDNRFIEETKPKYIEFSEVR